MKPMKTFSAAGLAGLLLALTACTGGDSREEAPQGFDPEGPVLAPAPTQAPPAPREVRHKPNIVEVLVDDMRWDDLKYAPRLRKLVGAKGVYLPNTFSNYPLCCPARASFLTGQLTQNHHVYKVGGAYGYQAFDDRRTLATSLWSAGYSTGFLGKYLNGYGEHEALAPKLTWEEGDREGGVKLSKGEPNYVNSRPPRVHSQYYVPAGWDEWRGSISGSHCKPVCGGTYQYFNYAWSENGVPTKAPKGRYSSTVIGEQAEGLVEQFSERRREEGNPFFLSLNYVAPHTGGSLPKYDPKRAEFEAHPCYVGSPAAPKWAYRSKLVRAIERGAGVRHGGAPEQSLRDKPRGWRKFPKPSKCALEGVRNSTTARAAAVYATDRSIGRLIRKLKAEGEWKRTIFLFWSDNGYFQGEHRRLQGKKLAYEPSFRVPLLLTGPGLRRSTPEGTFGGEDLHFPMDVIDLTATLLAFADAKAPVLGDGVSRKRELLQGASAWTQGVPFSSVVDLPWGRGRSSPLFREEREGVADPRTAIGLRTGRYTYVEYRNGERELYDLWTDPHQEANLLADGRWEAAHPGEARALQRAWEKLAFCAGAAECKAPLPEELVVDGETNRRESRKWLARMAATYGS